MFNNLKPNVILISDIGNQIPMEKTIGPYKIAKQLRDAGFEVAVLHHLMCFSLSEIKHILTHLISDKTLFVGVNNFFYQKVNQANLTRLEQSDLGTILPHGAKYNVEIKNLIQNANPNCKLVLGGPAAYDIEYNKIFDYIVLGYSEISMLWLAKHLIDPNFELPKARKSIFGNIVIDDSKAEQYDFVNHIMTYEEHDAILDNEMFLIEVARGCIFKCKFCSFPLNGKKKLDFIRTEESLYKELVTNFEKHKITRYTISDDTLNDSVEKCEMLYKLSQRLPFQLEFWAYIRLDLLAAHPETIDMLYQAGLRAPYYGIESLNEETAKFIGKGGSRSKLIDTLQFIKNKYKNNISQTGSFIFGLPRENLSSMQQTAEWLLSDQNPLDSWDLMPLGIRNSKKINSTNNFISDIDINWQNYGYIDTKENSDNGAIIWKNQFTNYNEVKSLIKETYFRLENNNKKRINGRLALLLASLTDSPSSSFLNKLHDEIDWHRLDHIKLQKTLDYKEKFLKTCSIPNNVRNTNCHTFAEFLQSIEYFK